MSDLLLSLSRWLERNSPPLRDVVWLILRLYVANVFFKSGLTKIDDWSTTLFLFTEEYHVPLLPPALAAVMGTAGELGLSALLVLGLAGRFSACRPATALIANRLEAFITLISLLSVV